MTATTPPYQPHHGPAPMAAAKSKQRWLIPVIVGAVVLFLCCVGGVVIAAVAPDPSDPESAAQSPREGRDRDRSPARSGDDAATESEPAEEPEGSRLEIRSQPGSAPASGKWAPRSRPAPM